MANKKKDARVAVFFPAAYPDKGRLSEGVRNLRTCFSSVSMADPPEKPHRHRARSAEEVYEEFKTVVREKYEIAIAARGGEGSLVLGRLLARSGEKYRGMLPLVVGFSDLTSLFWVLWKYFDQPSIYGPVVSYHFARFEEWKTSEQFFNILEGKNEMDLNQFGITDIVREGAKKVSGILMPVCLSVFAETVEEVPESPELILVVEDVNEDAYKVERYLNVLAYKGILTNCSAMILGDFTGADHPERIREAALEYAEEYDFALLAGLDFGHHLHSVSLPFGVAATLDISASVLQWKSFFKI